MTYSESYLNIVKKGNEDKIINLFKENECWDSFQVKQLQIIEGTPYPYILLELDIVGEFAAQFLGLFLDIRTYFSFYDSEDFYLPAIAYPHEYNRGIKQYVNREVSIAHELLHLSDIIESIENEPGYLERVYRYGFENVEDTGDLEESIEFEVGKIFRIEPKALGNDFKNGEKMIFEPFFLGMIMKYKCSTEAEYIRLSMCNYIVDLQEMYCEKFEEAEDKIKEYFMNSVNGHGREIFGEKPYERVLEIKGGTRDRMLNYETRDLKRASPK